MIKAIDKFYEWIERYTEYWLLSAVEVEGDRIHKAFWQRHDISK